jgi:large subunit ribosomal protein L10
LDRTPRKEKVEAVAEILDSFKSSKSAILTNYRGINVAMITKLRKNMREAGVDYKVVKNTLARIALHEMGIKDLDEHLEGPTAIAFGMTDPVAPAKVLMTFIREAKDVKDFGVKAGLLDGKFMAADGVKALADLPSKDVLLAMVAGMFASPLSSLASVWSAPIRNVAYALEAVRKQKEEASQAAD